MSNKNILMNLEKYFELIFHITCFVVFDPQNVLPTIVGNILALLLFAFIVYKRCGVESETIIVLFVTLHYYKCAIVAASLLYIYREYVKKSNIALKLFAQNSFDLPQLNMQQNSAFQIPKFTDNNDSSSDEVPQLVESHNIKDISPQLLIRNITSTLFTNMDSDVADGISEMFQKVGNNMQNNTRELKDKDT